MANERETLIELVRLHPVIWNFGTKAYTNRQARKEAWLRITEQMSAGRDTYTVAQLKDMWGNLLSQFRSNHKRARVNKGRTSWPLYGRMMFLVNNYQPSSASWSPSPPRTPGNCIEDTTATKTLPKKPDWSSSSAVSIASVASPTFSKQTKCLRMLIESQDLLLQSFSQQQVRDLQAKIFEAINIIRSNERFID